MKIQDLQYGRFNSRLGRQFLKLFYRPGKTYRLWFGPLRGLRMRYDPAVNFHAILGLWESETFELLDKALVNSGLLAKNSTVADVGGNIGYYTMWLCTVAAAGGSVYSFEPSPDALRFLKDNLKINNITNAEVVELACGDRVGTSEFYLADHHHSSSLHANWAAGGRAGAQKITVPMTTLDTFFSGETPRRAPAFIKFDIEGGGTHALPGCRKILRETRPFVLIESHTPEEDRAISNVLCEFDYCGYRMNNRRWVQKPEAIHPTEEGVWGTLLLVPRERHALVAAGLN